MPTFAPTDEQVSIIDFVRNETKSLLTVARAGAAKSTTLNLAAPGVRGSALALAFNVSIKKELEEKLPPNFTVLTMNGLGHRAWMKMMSGRKVKILDYKTSSIMRQHNIAHGDNKLRDSVREAVSAAKAHGLLIHDHGTQLRGKTFIPDTPEGWAHLADLADTEFSDEVVDLARYVLKLSIQEALNGTIDFGDQIYLPCVFNASFPSFPTVYVDEAQDLSPLNHHMISKLGLGARIIAVGDECQSIYAFRGADADSMPKLRERFNMETLSLTTTFRCAESIVENVHWRAPDMRAAPNAPRGEVTTIQSWGLSDILPDSAVICRLNAPLFKLGFALLGAGIPIKFLGKGMERGLAQVIETVSRRDSTCPAPTVHIGIEDWCALERDKALAVGNESRAENIQDKADALLSIPGATAGEMLQNLTTLLNADHGSILLCSGHKSKGLEFRRVYHLNPDIPKNFAKRAKSESAATQERNLSYVVDTRAKLYQHYIYTKGWNR